MFGLSLIYFFEWVERVSNLVVFVFVISGNYSYMIEIGGIEFFLVVVDIFIKVGYIWVNR